MRMGCYRCIAENEHGINNSEQWVQNEYKTKAHTHRLKCGESA